MILLFSFAFRLHKLVSVLNDLHRFLDRVIQVDEETHFDKEEITWLTDLFIFAVDYKKQSNVQYKDED
jgi:hypothetical protein